MSTIAIGSVIGLGLMWLGLDGLQTSSRVSEGHIRGGMSGEGGPWWGVLVHHLMASVYFAVGVLGRGEVGVKEVVMVIGFQALHVAWEYGQDKWLSLSGYPEPMIIVAMVEQGNDAPESGHRKMMLSLLHRAVYGIGAHLFILGAYWAWLFWK